MASSPKVARESKATDFDSLIRMLSISIVHVAKYYRTRQQDALLKVLAARHRHRDLDITPDLYKYWMNALIETVKTYDSQSTTRRPSRGVTSSSCSSTVR